MRHLWVAAAAFAASMVASAAAATEVTTIVAARDAVAHGDWTGAIAPLRALVAQSPANGEFRLSLARARYNSGDFAGASADYQAAFAMKAEDPAMAAYGAARCEARLQHTKEALAWLKTAVGLGLRRIDEARTLDDFAGLQSNAEFRGLVGLPPANLSRDEGWRGDIRFLADQVARRAYHPFRTETGDRAASGALYTKAEFEAKIDALIADVPKMGDAAIELALFRLVAALGDGHSAVEGARTREFGLTLPLGLTVFDEGLYVTSAAPAQADLVGAKVLALDGAPVASVLAGLDPLIARDNATWLKAMEPHYLRHVPFLKALGLATADDKVVLSVALGDGTRKDATVAADVSEPDIWNALPKPAGWTWIADASKSDFQQGNDKPYWWKWDAAGALLYVQYNKVADAPDKTLADFARELAAAIGKYPVEKLVVDMRNNNGGDTYLNEPLLAVIAGSAKVNRAGHLYVIIGRRTFSAAMNAVSYFGRFTQAVFVGEPTGGKPNAPGDEVPFALPYSGLAVNLSDRYWQGSWPDDFADTRGPDIAVPVTFADYAAGRDRAMEAIRAQPVLP
jgi:tetratricopeptide repeat protein